MIVSPERDNNIHLHPNTRQAVKESRGILSGFYLSGMNMVSEVCLKTSESVSWRQTFPKLRGSVNKS